MAPATGDVIGRNSAAAVLPGFALICTLYNEEGSVIEFLDSVYALDPIPEEFVIVDGDSTDRTNELIRGYVATHPTGMRVRHLVRPDWMKVNTIKFDNDPRPYVQGLYKFAEANDVAVADASRTWCGLWRKGIPYTTLLANSINHPDVRGQVIFADVLMALFPEE